MKAIRYVGLLFIVLLTLVESANSQCTITASVSPTTLPCGGGSVTLTANGSGFTTTLLDNDFDLGNGGPGWNVSPAATFTNPCDPSYDGGTYKIGRAHV